MPSDFVAFANEPACRDKARRLLIAKYFPSAERAGLYALTGLPVPSEDQMAQDASFQAPIDIQKQGREARFRLHVMAAYNYTCALSLYRLTTITGKSIVDAAHIHKFADSRNNDPRNGLALCKNAHWLFDNGLWTLTDDYKGHRRGRRIRGSRPRAEAAARVPREEDPASRRARTPAEPDPHRVAPQEEIQGALKFTLTRSLR